MPVPLPTSDGEAASSRATSQKSMSKAERRDLQEKQRAAKALAKATQAETPATPTSKKAGGSAAESKQHQSKESISGALAAVAGMDDQSGKAASRGLRIFSHFGLPKTTHATKGDIHPAIIRLGLLFSEFRISGANARCIATLNAFKTVIQDYSTPAHSTLSRHLMTYLSPQITHLVSARPMSVTMGNAIRQLKVEISGSDIDLPEQDAKDALCIKIDNYIRDRIIMADEVICDLAGKKIKDGDVILTYARSSVVEKVLLRAHEEGKRFSVIVVDSRPLLEGKMLLKVLTATEPDPIPCTYTLISALPAVITEVTTVMLGAHSLYSNGALYSRAGTALVALMAKSRGIPVVACCETYKFSEGVMLDGFGKNELAPTRIFNAGNGDAVQPFLEVLNPLYDLTPPTCITAVVTEVGLIPPSSISSLPSAMGRTSL